MGTPSRYYSSTAGRMTLQAAVSSSVTLLTVDTTVGLPSSVPFTLLLDPGQTKEEIVTVTAVAGTTLTVTRGEDSSTPQSHDAGAEIRHAVSARDFRDSREHEAAVAAHGVTSQVVGTTDVQTLTNKTITSANTIDPAAVTGLNPALAGTLNTTGDQSVSGNKTFTGNTTFSGSVSGTTATLSGALTGASASFSGNVSTGALSAPSATLSGALTGTTASFSGNVTAPNVQSVKVYRTQDTGAAQPNGNGGKIADGSVGNASQSLTLFTIQDPGHPYHLHLYGEGSLTNAGSAQWSFSSGSAAGYAADPSGAQANWTASGTALTNTWTGRLLSLTPLSGNLTVSVVINRANAGSLNWSGFRAVAVVTPVV